MTLVWVGVCPGLPPLHLAWQCPALDVRCLASWVAGVTCKERKLGGLEEVVRQPSVPMWWQQKNLSFMTLTRRAPCPGVNLGLRFMLRAAVGARAGSP